MTHANEHSPDESNKRNEKLRVCPLFSRSTLKYCCCICLDGRVCSVLWSSSSICWAEEVSLAWSSYTCVAAQLSFRPSSLSSVILMILAWKFTDFLQCYKPDFPLLSVTFLEITSMHMFGWLYGLIIQQLCHIYVSRDLADFLISAVSLEKYTRFSHSVSFLFYFFNWFNLVYLHLLSRSSFSAQFM